MAGARREVRTEPGTGDREIIITRIIDAPRELVFEAFTEVRHLSQWWGPEGFGTTTRSFDFRVGGAWDFVMHGPDGTDYQEFITWTEIAPPERIALLPDTPTLAESGLEGFNLSAWHAIWAPAGTPEDVRKRLSGALQKALADQEVIDRLATLGTTPVSADLATPAAMDERFKSEIERWSRLLAEAPAN